MVSSTVPACLCQFEHLAVLRLSKVREDGVLSPSDWTHGLHHLSVNFGLLSLRGCATSLVRTGVARTSSFVHLVNGSSNFSFVSSQGKLPEVAERPALFFVAAVSGMSLSQTTVTTSTEHV